MPLPQQNPLIAPTVPNNQQAPVPAYNPTIQGIQGMQLDSGNTERIRNFLSTYNVPKRLNGVFIVPDEAWDKVMAGFNVPQRQARVAFAFPTLGRAFINANVLKEKNWKNGVEWALAHELAHMNDPKARPYGMQEQEDGHIDQGARDMLDVWAKKYWKQ